MNDFEPLLEIPGDFEPLFRSQIPKRTSDAFSRQWYAPGSWKFDEPTIMGKVDKTTAKMADLIFMVSRLGTDGIIPSELYSSLFDYLQWMMRSIGAYRISIHMVGNRASASPVIRYVDKTEKIYPKFGIVKKRDWDPVVFGDGRGYGTAEYCVVMPSLEGVKWLNEVSAYCKGMDEWAKGTYLQTQEKLAESKQFLKNLHKQLIVSGNVYITEEEARRGLGL